MTDKQQKAIEIFKNNYNCAQSVLSTFSEQFGLSKDSALKLANTFGAGIVYQQHTCGAVNGALMTIGLKFGKGEHGTDADKETANDMASHFIAEFKKINGSINCLQLLEEINISSPEGIALARERNIFQTHCEKYVKDAVSITEKIVNR